jgi:hypothetical protein
LGWFFKRNRPLQRAPIALISAPLHSMKRCVSRVPERALRAAILWISWKKQRSIGLHQAIDRSMIKTSFRRV